MSYHSNLDHIAAALVGHIDNAVRESAEAVMERAKQRVPVNTGRLKDSIHVERQGISEYEVVVGGQGVFYGHIVEHGGTHTPARPFLVPALESYRQEAYSKVLAAIQGLL